MSDSLRLSECKKLKNPHKLRMMGSANANLLKEPRKEDLPEILSDFDYDYLPSEAEVEFDLESQKKLETVTAATEVFVINQPREGKKLLVLDLDHTLLDITEYRSAHAIDLKRPHMDQFLCEVYPHYDIVIWSQTSWRWLEAKLTELGMLSHPHFKICFVLDKTAMFKVPSKKHPGRTHSVKPLQLIWTKFPRWHERNTIHVDDLARNFAMNPSAGLKCTGYYRSKQGSAADSELLVIARYLRIVGEFPTLDGIDHMSWQQYLNDYVPDDIGKGPS